MNSKRYIHFIVYFIIVQSAFQKLSAQQYADSIFNLREINRIRTYIKCNERERVGEFYENDTLRLKLIGSSIKFNNWNSKTAFKENFYVNGRLKSAGHFFLLWSKELYFEIPIDRHTYNSRNGKIEKISQFSDYGVQHYGSTFNKKGEFVKTKVYE